MARGEGFGGRLGCNNRLCKTRDCFHPTNRSFFWYPILQPTEVPLLFWPASFILLKVNRGPRLFDCRALRNVARLQ